MHIEYLYEGRPFGPCLQSQYSGVETIGLSWDPIQPEMQWKRLFQINICLSVAKL